MKLTYEKAGALLGALRGLDGFERVIRDGERERTVRQSYKFSVALRLDIAKNISALEPVNAAFIAARDGALKEIAGEDMAIDPQKEPTKAARFAQAERELFGQETDELALFPIKLEALALQANEQIPPSLLAALGPLLATQE